MPLRAVSEMGGRENWVDRDVPSAGLALRAAWQVNAERGAIAVQDPQMGVESRVADEIVNEKRMEALFGEKKKGVERRRVTRAIP